MALIAKDSGGGGTFTPAPEGTHFAICYRVLDLGTVRQQGNYPGEKRCVLLSWELPDETYTYKDEQGVSQERPFTVHGRYTLSLNEKARLRQHLESWRGKGFSEEELGGFDLFAVLGKSCLVTIKHDIVKDKTYSNVAAVGALPKSMKERKLEKPSNKVISFAFDDWDGTTLPEIPEGLLKQLQETPEWKRKAGTSNEDDVHQGETIPF